jgi:hypothetical protein
MPLYVEHLNLERRQPMKQDQPLPSDRNVFRSTRPVLLLLAAALVGFVTTNSAVIVQSKQELCQNNKTRLAELEKQAQTLQEELSFTNGTEDNARALLSTLNKALVDPQRSDPGHFVRVYLPTPAYRQMAVEKWGGGLPWKDEYLDDDVLLLRALRDVGIRRVERVKYVLTHKPEIQQQKANADQQIAYHRNRLAELRCGESSSSSAAAQPCTADEAAAFARMSGSWKSYQMHITIGGSCEEATGTFKYAEWCEGVDETSNSSLARTLGSFNGRMSGGSYR